MSLHHPTDKPPTGTYVPPMSHHPGTSHTGEVCPVCPPLRGRTSPGHPTTTPHKDDLRPGHRTPLNHPCTMCGANPGQPCTSLTSNLPVLYHHWPRFDATRGARP